jgi:hypothetical protein
MINPFLRSAVWLNDSQRALLLSAAEMAMKNPKSDSFLCESVIKEIEAAEISARGQAGYLANIFAKGLRLPQSARPVNLCFAEISEVVRYSPIDLGEIYDALGVDPDGIKK